MKLLTTRQFLIAKTVVWMKDNRGDTTSIRIWDILEGRANEATAKHRDYLANLSNIGAKRLITDTRNQYEKEVRHRGNTGLCRAQLLPTLIKAQKATI